MYCMFCGAQIKDFPSEFCNQCGGHVGAKSLRIVTDHGIFPRIDPNAQFRARALLDYLRSVDSRGPIQDALDTVSMYAKPTMTKVKLATRKLKLSEFHRKRRKQ